MPLPVPAPSVSGPDRFFRQHGEIEAPAINDKEFRPAWRRVSRLDQLLRDHAISGREWRCAVNFRSVYEKAYRGTLSGQDRNAVYVDQHCRQRSQREPTESALDAGGRLMVIRRTLGPCVFALLVPIVVDDNAWTAIAQHFGVYPRTIKRCSVTALQALATL